MPLQIIRQDITKIECDAIVNPSNSYLEPGGGADLAIHEAAGPELYDACQKIGGCNVGEAVITPGFKLPCRYVIHTAGPRWSISKQKEHEGLLSSCYKKCLEVAKNNNCESLAFPLISAGAYGFPLDITLKIAMREIQDFLFENEMLVYLVVYNKKAFRAASRVFKDIQEFIDDFYVDKYSEDEVDIERTYSKSAIAPNRNELRKHRKKIEAEKQFKRDNSIFCETCMECDSVIPMGKSSTDGFIIQLDETFAVKLLKLIDVKGMSDVECYKKANVSKQTWHKIMNDEKYKPSKNTIIAFAISLELTYDETQCLLETVGFTLSRSNKFDVIISYFLQKRIYDIFEINNTLFSYDHTGLGCYK